MATISIEEIKSLRDETGVSVMQCKKALEEAGGDRAKAIVILRKKGGDAANKKSDRTLGAGVVASYVHANSNVASMVELQCETDFVAKNPEFKDLAYDIAMQIAATNPNFVTYEEVTEEAREKALEVFKPEVEGKPEEMKEKILNGKLEAYFREEVLMMQNFIKDQDLTIADLVNNAVQKFGEKVKVARFVCYRVLE